MDYLKKARWLCGIFVCVMLFMPLNAGADEILGADRASQAAMPPYIYDSANILTEDEEADLLSLALEYKELHGVHFAILTLNNENITDLETYTREFFEENIYGESDIYECAIMTVNMGTRRVANDFFGELRTMISDDEASVIREGYTYDMTEGNYYSAARFFLDEAAMLVERKFAYYRIETPEVDPKDLVYDFDNILSPAEYDELKQAARELTDSTGIAHIIVILNNYEYEDYLQRFASSFYKQNFENTGLYEGAFILTISAEGKESAISPFGSYSPDNYTLWDIKYEVNYRLIRYSTHEGCMYFITAQNDDLRIESLTMPAIDPALKIYDYAGVLSDEQENNLRAMIGECREKHGVDLMIILSDSPSEKIVEAISDEFRREVSEYHANNTQGNSATLLISAPPRMESETQYIDIDLRGSKVYKKIGWNQESDIRYEVRLELENNGDYYGACAAFIEQSSKALSSIIPNVQMIDNIDWALQMSALAGLAVAAATLLTFRIMHGFGMKRKVSGGNYLVHKSLRLYYARDIFLHSHTSKSKKSDDSSSGGSSGSSTGSSGGGTSSRSEGSF